MLILSRRVGEALMIGDEVSITVLSVKGKQVRLGIDAPEEISVHREEIYQRIKGEAAGVDIAVDTKHLEETPKVGNE